MAEGTPSGGSKGKKVLGQSPTAWAVEGVAAVTLLLLYRWWRSRSAGTSAGTAGAATPLEGGTGGIPVAITSSTTAVTSAPSTFTAWVNKALTMVTQLAKTTSFGVATAYDAITAWQAGQCVSHAGYTYISGLIGNLGLPPDGVNYPLSVCKTSTATTTPKPATPTPAPAPAPAPTPAPAPSPAPAPVAPTSPTNPGLSAALRGLLQPGERVVASAYDAATSTWLYLTNLGGIYTENNQGAAGGTFYGSYLGLPAGDRLGTRSFIDLQVQPTGAYTAVATDGSRYTFNPTTARLENV